MTDLTVEKLNLREAEMWGEDHYPDGTARFYEWSQPFLRELFTLAKEALAAREDGGWKPQDVRYFIDGSNDRHLLTIEQLHRDIKSYWDYATSEGWPEEMEYLQVYKCVPISRPVEIDRRVSMDCPMCCGGHVEDEIVEGSDGALDCCPHCEGNHLVDSFDQDEIWHHDFEEVVFYEMRPPLPPPPTQQTEGEET